MIRVDWVQRLTCEAGHTTTVTPLDPAKAAWAQEHATCKPPPKPDPPTPASGERIAA